MRERLKLELSDEKTLITHARTQAARFLGYEVGVIQRDHRCDRTGRRATNGTIALKVPADVAKAKCAAYTRRGKPVHLTERVFDTDFSIVAQYQQEFRGLAEYYRLAYNLSPRLTPLKHVMEQSLTKTLARKYRVSVPKVYDRYRALLATPDGPRKGLRVTVEREGRRPLVAQWGGISLKRRLDVALDDAPRPVRNARTELVQRLLADACELCGSTDRVAVHHVRGIKDVERHGRPTPPAWVEKMVARHRKTLVVCGACHRDIHAGRADGSHRTKQGHWRAG